MTFAFNKFETKDLIYDKTEFNFHNEVIRGYKQISKLKRCVNIDASLSKIQIHKNILNSLTF